MRDDWRRPALFLRRAGERAHRFAALKAGHALVFVGRHDVPAAVFLDVVNLAVGIHGRGETDRAERNLATNLRAVLGVQHEELARIVGAKQQVIDLEDGALAVGNLQLFPDFTRLRDVALPRAVYSNNSADFSPGNVLLAVTRIDHVA